MIRFTHNTQKLKQRKKHSRRHTQHMSVCNQQTSQHIT